MIPDYIKLITRLEDTVASFATWSVLHVSHDYLAGFWKESDVRPAHLWRSWRGALPSLAQDQNPQPTRCESSPVQWIASDSLSSVYKHAVTCTHHTQVTSVHWTQLDTPRAWCLIQEHGPPSPIPSTAFHSHHTRAVWQSALQFVGRFNHFNGLREREKG